MNDEHVEAAIKVLIRYKRAMGGPLMTSLGYPEYMHS